MSRALFFAALVLSACGGERVQGLPDAGDVDAGYRGPAPEGIPELTALGSYRSVQLDWQLDGEKAPVDRFRVYFAAEAFTEWSSTLMGADARDVDCCEALVDALTPGVTYSFTLAAVNGGGEGPRSDVVSATPQPIGLDWKKLPDLPVPRYDVGVAVLDGKVYAVGGDSGSVLPLVDVFDPATNAWTPRAPLPAPRAGALVVATGGRVYAFGGRPDDSFSSGSSTEVYAYDPAADQWTACSPMPGPVDSVTGAVEGDRVHVLLVHQLAPSYRVYDPGADTWSGPLSFPSAITVGSLASYGGTLYSYGPHDFDRLDASSGNWIGLPLPADPATLTQQQWTGLVSTSDALFAIGRQQTDITTWSGSALRYDSAGGSWHTVLAPFTARDHAGVTASGDQLFIVGGQFTTGGQGGLPVPLGTFEIATVVR